MPHILNTEVQIREMLEVIGVSSVEDLYSQIPCEIKLKDSLNLPPGFSEFEVKKKIEALSEKNTPLRKFNSFLGAGCYDHYVPAALPFILSQSGFLTAYTPYQAECSQGILQAIYEYQTYMCFLTGMDVSNASLFDGASALAEAVLMALRITHRKKILIPKSLHPEYRQTLKTYLSGFNFKLQEVDFSKDGFIDILRLEKLLDDDTACFVLQNPNFFGMIEEAGKTVEILKQRRVLSVMVTNPLSLAFLKEPSSLGVDIVCGDGQPLGGRLNFGGPSFGFLAARKDYVRQMPGRIVGKTEDKDGKSAYCLTLQTREQHIRREKATSNICSNHSLQAIGAAVYLSLMGKEGFRKVACNSFNNAHYLYQRLKTLKGVNLPFPDKFFHEFVWEVQNAANLINKLYKKRIIAGYYLGKVYQQFKNGILSCCTEKKSKEDIDNFVDALREVL